jgi:pimeloyl-ACP methyl ester carboxylesterase
MPTVPVADATLSYREQGAGAPLVLAHGFTGTGAGWAAVAAALADRYRVLVPDLRGHGRSTGAPETIRSPQFADDLIALLDHLGLERAHFVGHSDGATALLFVGTAHLERVATLTLVGGGYAVDDRLRTYGRGRLAAWAADPAWIEGQRQRHDAANGADHWRVLLGRLDALFDGQDALPLRLADLAAVARPVLVLHGDRDPWYPLPVATRLYETLPRAELAVLPAVGHALPWEQPDLFVRLVADVLVRHADA